MPLILSNPRSRTVISFYREGVRRSEDAAHDLGPGRVGIKPEGRAPAREATVITDVEGRSIGIVTSGGFGPAVNGPIAMGYVETQFAKSDTRLMLVVRGNPLPALVATLPFIPHNYKRERRKAL